MKTAGTTHTTISSPLSNPSANAAFFKTSAKYMMGALEEGIKQSLNGMDINVEFITLTARSLAQTSGKAVKKFIAKYSFAGRQITERRFQYNNNTSLSHS